jgi:uncharacterized membrane protein YdbT with pleckstrin-like domain
LGSRPQQNLFQDEHTVVPLEPAGSFLQSMEDDMWVAFVEIFCGLVCACVSIYCFFDADWFTGVLMIIMAIIFATGVVEELGD